MTEINTKKELIEFIQNTNSIELINKLLKACYETNLIMFEDTPIEMVKERTIEWIELYGDNKEVPLFINHKEMFKW